MYENSKILVVSGMAFLIVALPSVALSQDKATAQEVVAQGKRKAASALSKTGDLTQFNQKQSSWVWKDTYMFVHDCDKKSTRLTPFKPEQIGQDLTSNQGHRRKKPLPGPGSLCNAARKPSGVWVEYWWAKPARRRAPARSAIT